MGEPSAAYLLGDPGGTAARSLTLLMAPLEFGGQVTSVLGWVFRFYLLALPVRKDFKEISSVGLSLNFVLCSLSLLLETLSFEHYLRLTEFDLTVFL